METEGQKRGNSGGTKIQSEVSIVTFEMSVSHPSGNVK